MQGMNIYFIYRMTSACQKKCVSPKFIEGDLNKAETACLDRCVSKYVEIQKLVDTKFGQEMQAGQQKVESLGARAGVK